MNEIKEALKYYSRNRLEFVADVCSALGLFGLLWVCLFL